MSERRLPSRISAMAAWRLSDVTFISRLARRILAISSLFLRISAPAEPEVDRSDQPRGDLVGVADAVDGHQLVLLHVPGDERRRLLLVELEATADGALGVVLPLHDLAT